MYSKAEYIKILFFVVGVIVSFSVTGCSSGSVGEDEDTSSPSVALISPAGGEVVAGMFSINWTTNDKNLSTVEIRLSSDSGATYPTFLAKAPDTGTYAWSSSDAPDGTNYRIQVTATDIVGNVSSPARSGSDFQINNVPHVMGNARFYDTNLNAILDVGDLLIVPFDHDLAGVASPADFYLPVFGDNVGGGSAMALGPASNEVTIVAGSFAQIRSRGNFDFNNVLASIKNSPSGVDLLTDTPILLSATSGFPANRSSFIDIIPGFSPSDVTVECYEEIESGDLNLDGIPDIICSNGAQFSFYINEGAGFRKRLKSGKQTLTPNINDIELGDMDGDGDLDLIAASEGTSVIWRNNGPRPFATNSGPSGPRFTSTGQNLFSIRVRAAKFADLNGDGDLDIVVGAYNDTSRTLINNGSGVFATAGGTNFGISPVEDVAVGDIDGDGDNDVILIRDGQSHGVYRKNWTGGFSLIQSIPATAGRAGKLLDVDGDSDQDLVIVNNNQSHTIWINDGSGIFTPGQTLAASSGKTLSVGDIDSDKDIDIVVGNSTAADQVYINNGLGTFASSGGDIVGAGGVTNTSSSVLVDFEQDGAPDYVFATPTAAASINLFRNSMSATWGSVTLVDNSETYPVDDTGMEIADFNGDGFVDLLVDSLSGGSGSRVLLNDGTGTFVDSNPAIGTNTGLKDFAVADLDNDGDLDFVNSRGARIWFNNGNGTFTANTSLVFSAATAQIFDVDRDGDPDIVMGTSTARVWKNNGSGVFTNTSNFAASGSIRDSAIGDLDGDGDIDIVISRQNGRVYIYVNDGSGIFTVFGSALTGVGDARSIAIGDVDKDGLPDVMKADWGSGVRWWRNISNFQLPINFEYTAPREVDASGLARTYGSIALKDINGDGYVDVVAGGGTGDPDAADVRGSVLINDGSGNFVRTQSYGALLDGERQTIAIDIDNDGDKDAISISRGTIRVYRSQ